MTKLLRYLAVLTRPDGAHKVLFADGYLRDDFHWDSQYCFTSPAQALRAALEERMLWNDPSAVQIQVICESGSNG
jgi:hypothetical protein